jgi:phenylacetate-CoA ligase
MATVMSVWLDNLYERAVGRGLIPFYETRLRGRNTFRYRAEFEANQWLWPDQIAALQWERLQALLRHAYATAPYYRELFDREGLRPEDIRDPEAFRRLPMLEKAHLRNDGHRMVSSAFPLSSLTRSASGGSTGDPAQYYYNRDSYERRMAAAMRGDKWAGWRLGAPELYVWGTQLLPRHPLLKLKGRLHHAALRRTDLNSFDVNAENARRAVARMNRVHPVVVGYANSIYEFARLIQELDLRVVPPRSVILTAEKVYPHQKELIRKVLGAPVFDRYGCREVMMIGAECDRHDGMHVTADNLYVEIVRDGRPCEPGEVGEVLLTDLHNYGMPLIRYRVGDLSAWKGEDCPCGRGLPLLKGVEGRSLDTITTPGGKIISGIFFPQLLKDFPAVRTFEVVQEERELIRVRVALQGRLEPEAREFWETTASRTIGPDVRIEWEIGDDVEIERRAKFRPVQSRVPMDFQVGAGR